MVSLKTSTIATGTAGGAVLALVAFSLGRVDQPAPVPASNPPAVTGQEGVFQAHVAVAQSTVNGRDTLDLSSVALPRSEGQADPPTTRTPVDTTPRSPQPRLILDATDELLVARYHPYSSEVRVLLESAKILFEQESKLLDSVVRTPNSSGSRSYQQAQADAVESVLKQLRDNLRYSASALEARCSSSFTALSVLSQTSWWPTTPLPPLTALVAPLVAK